MNAVSVFLENPVPVFAPTDAQFARLRALLPGRDVRLCRSEAAFLAALPETETALVWTFRQEWFALAPKLRAVCTPAAGRDYFRVVPPPGVELRYGSFHGAIMGETAAAAVLGFARGLLPFASLMRADGGSAAWPRDAFAPVARRVAGSVAVVLGFGHIGRAAGEKLHALGVRVVGVSRGPHPAPDWFGPDDRLATAAELDAVLPLADHLLCFLPSGPETDRLLDARRLALLKPGAFLCNFGRGNLLDEHALAAALRAGRLGGALLDVFSEEPLPLSSPLRTAPRCWLLPHASAFAPDYLDLYFEDFARLASPAGARGSAATPAGR